MLVCVCLVVGWLLHDLAIVAGSASAGLAGRIVIRSFVFAATFSLVGLVLARAGARAVGLAGALIAATALTVALVRPAIDPAFIGLTKTVLLLVFSSVVLARFGRPSWWVGLAAGFGLAAAATAARRLHWGPVTGRYLVVEAVLLAAALIVFSAAYIRRPRGRRAAAAAGAVVAVAVVVGGSVESRRLPRADLSQKKEAAANQPNLLFVVLDTVRADHLEVYGYHRRTMPGLETVVARSFDVFTQARSTSSWTLPSHGSLLTGLMPGEHGATHTRKPEDGASVALKWSFANRLRSDVPTLAGRLLERGFRTAAIVANDGVLTHEMGLDRGFAHYDDRPGGGLQCRQLLLQQMGWDPQFACLPYRDATTVTNLALSWLRTESSTAPFFLFLNYMDAHEPYQPPSPFASAFDRQQPSDRLKPPPDLKALQYDRELKYLDSQLMRLLGWVRAAGLWDDTVIVITSDHGEAFGDHGHWGHAQNLYEELLRVPLFVKGAAAGRPPRQVDLPIRGNEVHDLILTEMGFAGQGSSTADPTLIAEWYGSLAPETGRPHVSRDLLAWLEGPTKTIVSDAGEVEVFDLVRDSDEAAGSTASPLDDQGHVQRSRDYWASLGPGDDSAELSPEALARLRALGYLSSENGEAP